MMVCVLPLQGRRPLGLEEMCASGEGYLLVCALKALNTREYEPVRNLERVTINKTCSTYTNTCDRNLIPVKHPL